MEEKVFVAWTQKFPMCPLCKSDKGYSFSVHPRWFDKHVKCNGCGAKWFLGEKENEGMARLEQAPKDPILHALEAKSLAGKMCRFDVWKELGTDRPRREEMHARGNKTSFGESFYETLRENKDYQQFVADLITPTKSQIRKSQVSSAIGHIASKTVGVGWRSGAGLGITFKGHPIRLMTIFDHKRPWNAKVYFYFSTKGHATRDDLHKRLWIGPKTKGFIHKEIVGVNFQINECLGTERIRKDEELNSDLYKLFRTGAMVNISDYTSVPITVEFKEKNNALVGIIEACIAKVAPKEILTLLFCCTTKIAKHVQAALDSRADTHPGIKEAARARVQALMQKYLSQHPEIKDELPEVKFAYFLRDVMHEKVNVEKVKEMALARHKRGK